MEIQGRHVDPEIAAYKVWNTIIKTYTQTLITMPGDKLIALSGIAKNMMDIVQDEYVVGMWRKHLESSLLWHVDKLRKIDGSPASRSTDYRAPSWSWASVDGEISPDNVSDQDLTIKVEDVHIEYATDDTTGVVTGGWLDLTGSLKPMRLGHLDFIGKRHYTIVINNQVLRPRDETLEEDFRVDPLLDLDVPPKSDEIFDADNTEQRLFFMICRMPSSDGKFMQILLLRLTDLNTNLFERIGFAQSIVPECQDTLLADLDESTKRSLPCSRYANGLHTIRLI